MSSASRLRLHCQLLNRTSLDHFCSCRWQTEPLTCCTWVQFLRQLTGSNRFENRTVDLWLAPLHWGLTCLGLWLAWSGFEPSLLTGRGRSKASNMAPVFALFFPGSGWQMGFCACTSKKQRSWTWWTGLFSFWSLGCLGSERQAVCSDNDL